LSEIIDSIFTFLNYDILMHYFQSNFLPIIIHTTAVKLSYTHFF